MDTMDVSEDKVISDLPEEILEYILNFLSPYGELKQSMLVCKQWHRITSGVISKQQFDFQRAIDNVALEWVTSPTETKPTITERYSHSAVYYNQMLYVFGGCTSTNTTFNDLWCFDLAHRVWIRPLASGNYPSPKACASMVLYEDKLILFGGWSHPTPYPLHQAARFFNQLHVYETSGNRWHSVACQNSPQGKAGHAAVVMGDTMVVFGGSHGHGVSSNDLWVLDLKEMVWKTVETSGVKPEPRYGHSLLVVDDCRLLLMGGCGGPNNQFSDIWLLDSSDEVWRWKEVKVQGQENSPQQLWCHPACRVGSKVVVLSKTNRPPPATLSSTPPAPLTTKLKPKQPLLTTQLAQVRRAMPDTSESSSQDSSSDTDDVAQRNCRTVRLRNAARSPHHKHSAAGRSGAEADRTQQGIRAGGSREVTVQPDSLPSSVTAAVVCRNCRRERDVCTCEEGFCPDCSPASRSAICRADGLSATGASASNTADTSDPAFSLRLATRSGDMDEEEAGPSGNAQGERVVPFKVPFKSSCSSGRSGTPSVRPNASKNRQKQLEALRMYEEKFKAKMAAAGVDSADVKVQGHSVEVVKAVKKVQNPMYIHTLDLKDLDRNTVTWLPLVENSGSVPEETIFYSINPARGELVMFGGIQADLGSMQRGLNVDQQVVSNTVHFMRPRSLRR